MSNYSRILNEFVQKVGCNQGDKFNDYTINRALDKLLQMNAGQNEFTREVSMEIYEQTPKNMDGTVTLRDFINTLLRANEILYHQISQTERQLQKNNTPQQRQELQGNLEQFTDDLMLINKTFNLPGPTRQSASRKSNSQVMPRQSKSGFKNDSSQVSGIFQQQPSDREQSTSLKLALILLALALVMELILMFVRHHFLNCLSYIAVFAIYLLNYFDRSYIRTCIYLLITSIVFDIIWLIVMAGPYWNNHGSHRSSMRPGFLAFIYIMTIILMGVRVVIMIILVRYRNNTESTRKSVKIFNIRFDLDGRPVSNPVYNILNKGSTEGDHVY